MERYSLREAQDRLQQLMIETQQGKTIVILDENDQAAQLISVVSTAKKRKVGSARGLITMSDDFDAPLDEFHEYME